MEQTAAPSGCKHGAETNIELDTYAILPSSALFSDIVRIALLKIGYSSSEAMGAKGQLYLPPVSVRNCLKVMILVLK